MNKLFKTLIILFLVILTTSCGNNFFKRSDVKDNPVNVEERVKRNIEEGKGVRFQNLLEGKSGGTFDFASSNELWRASVEILDFVPLTNASYSGGIIITDWFKGKNTSETDRQLKITVRFLSNEIRADALKVSVHEKKCIKLSSNCDINLIQSNVSEEIKLAILKKAALMERNDTKKKRKPYLGRTKPEK
ncbi:hypothetical protein HIMB5_00013590 [alpha proteobacterium HIMB5]|nr:hypothetical protein HIMB5_00013590 [alpha proteobacterium HIMB5]